MLASPLPPSYLDTFSQSTSSLGCRALYMVISFLVLWSICLSSVIIIIIIIIICEFLTLTGWYSLKTEWDPAFSIFRNILNILADLNSSVILMVFLLPLISSSLALFYCPWSKVINFNWYRYIWFINIKVKLATLVEGDPKAPFSIATTPRCRRGRNSMPWIAPLYP